MIADRRAEGKERPDLLGRLLTARDDDDGATMSDKQVRDEIVTLFLEAHETTASSVAWAIHLLSRSPEVYRAARAEADALGRPPRHEDLPKLKLLVAGVQGVAPPLPAAAPLHARRVRGPHGRRLPPARGDGADRLPLRDPPPRRSVAGPGALRPGPLHPGGGGGAPALRVPAVLGGPARVHRQPLRARWRGRWCWPRCSSAPTSRRRGRRSSPRWGRRCGRRGCACGSGCGTGAGRASAGGPRQNHSGSIRA